MASETNKKLTILYIYEILKEYTDENHFLTQSDIIEKMKQLYGMECERKSIGANIDLLIDFGIDIEKVKGKGCYLAERLLEPGEVTFIVDAIFSSKSINGKYSKDLANKLTNTLSKFQRKKYNYIYKSEQVTRSSNKELFLNIEKIQEAIENNKKIKFKYNRFNLDKLALKKQQDKDYKINPYFMVNSKGLYYLVCNNDYFDSLSNYRIDLISNLQILDEEIKPAKALKGYENGIDISKYVNENIYLFGDKTVKATLKIEEEYSVNYVYEWFGDKARFYEKNGEIFADIEISEMALIYWAMQYGESVQVVSPDSTREKIKSLIQKIHNKYFN